MTVQQTAALGRYIRWVANELGLRDWTITLKPDPPDDDEALSSTLATPGRKLASIRVCREFSDIEPNEQRQTIVHELLHLHFIAAIDILRLDLWDSRLLSQDAYNLLCNAYRRQMEYGIDGLADSISKHYPLIEWEKEADCGEEETTSSVEG